MCYDETRLCDQILDIVLGQVVKTTIGRTCVIK